MNSPLRLAGAAALGAALLLTACAKHTDQTTTSDTTSTQAAADAGATPAADAGETTPAPDAGTTPVAEVSPSTTTATSAATTGPMTVTTVSGTNGASSGGYINLPVYPGSSEMKEQAMSSSSDEGSVAMKIYSTKDDAKKVAEWYKAHLPASFKGGILTAGDKTVGTWADEHKDGDQNVIVGSDSSSGTTRIQLTTKHGK